MPQYSDKSIHHYLINSQYQRSSFFICLIFTKINKLSRVRLFLIYRYIVIQMGQANNGQSSGSSDYVVLREVPNGSIVKEAGNGKLHFVKEYSFTNQESYQQAFVNFSKKLPEKHQHILYLERTNTKVENTFCSTFYKISLLYEYLDHTLEKEIRQRLQ